MAWVLLLSDLIPKKSLIFYKFVGLFEFIRIKMRELSLQYLKEACFLMLEAFRGLRMDFYI